MRLFIRRMLPLALMLCLLAGSALATNVGSSLVVGIQSTKTALIQPLDPVERDMMSIYGLVYESLVYVDDDYMPQPGLCESWEESGSGKTWTFTLRKNITFSDGTPLTAHDVVATAQYILDRANEENTQNPGYYYNMKYFVKSISASGDDTVVVKTASGRNYWGVLYVMTFPVLPQDRVTADNPPGTGPYVISTFQPGDYLWLKTNDTWWQTRPQVEEIMVIMHDSPSKVIESYEYARVDTVFTRSIAAAQHKSGTTSLALDYRTNQLETLLINHGFSPMNSLNVRKALRYLIDPDKIAKQVYMGMVERTDTPMIPGTWMYNENLSQYFVTDVEAAKALLEEDGWEDSDDDGVLDRLNAKGEKENLHLRIFVYEEPDNNVRVETANLIADMLAQAGISTKITVMTMSEMQTKLKAASFDLALASFAMDVCPDPGYLLMKGNTGNYGLYKSDEMTKLCKELRTQTTKDGYQATLMSIQQRFAEDVPFICLFYRSGSVLTRQMYTTVRDVRELQLLRGIESFHQ